VCVCVCVAYTRGQLARSLLLAPMGVWACYQYRAFISTLRLAAFAHS